MKCLVTGGAGFIGSHLVDHLLNLNHNVIVIDNESAEENNKFYWNEKACNYQYDICDYNKIEPLFIDVDYVFHLAAQSRIQPSIINPHRTFKVNCNGTLNILKAASKYKIVKVVYSSTSSYYGSKNKIPFKENMDRDCLNPYSYTKAFGEDLCKMYNHIHKLDITILRYFNVYGPRQPIKGQYAPVVGIFQKQQRSNQNLTVVGDGNQRRDYTHVEDIVKANLLAINKDLGSLEILNVGTGKNWSVLDLAEMIGGNIEFISKRRGEAAETLADITKIKKKFNWSPAININSWIKDRK